MRRTVGLGVVFLVLVSGCKRCQNSNYQYSITTNCFFETGGLSTNVAGLRINSETELVDYIEKVPLPSMKEYLSSLTNMVFDSTFIYVTYNAELFEIRNTRGMSVNAAILNKTERPCIGVYIIEGCSTFPIKATLK